MNSLTAAFSILVASFFAMMAFRLTTKISKVEEENRILWEQVNRYEAHISARAQEDEERQRAAIRN